MEDKINRIFDKLENADVSPSSNYSMPEYYMHCAMRGSEKEKRTLFNWISMFTGIDVDTISNIFDERYNNVQNESRNMKQTIRLRESELRRMISETVKRVLMEARKPNDRMIGRHKFKGEYYDRNGNPIYTHPSRLDDPEGGTLSDDFLKDYGWRYSKKRGLHGQISDPTRFPK